jgi:hypothetical protein
MVGGPWRESVEDVANASLYFFPPAISAIALAIAGSLPVFRSTVDAIGEAERGGICNIRSSKQRGGETQQKGQRFSTANQHTLIDGSDVTQSRDRNDQLFAFPFPSAMRYQSISSERQSDVPAK